jgi:hypothetical protein
MYTVDAAESSKPPKSVAVGDAVPRDPNDLVMDPPVPSVTSNSVSPVVGELTMPVMLGVTVKV